MQQGRIEQLQDFCRRQGIVMRDLSLLDMALTHTSYAHESKKKAKNVHNERIEFLGDSVLSIVVSTYMYNNFPNLNEGQLTRMRANLVCEASLFELAKKLGLGKLLLLGKGESLSGGRGRASILADAFESLLGAVYLDQGFEAAQAYLLGIMQEQIDFVCSNGIFNDYKTRLQELLQRNGDIDIAYKLVGSDGPEHDKTFTSVVIVSGNVSGRGSGHSKKDAEQQAAKAALDRLNEAAGTKNS